MTALPAPPFDPHDPFPRFSAAEYQRRHAAARELLAALDADALLAVGVGADRHEIQYLSNAPVRWESVLVLPADGEPTLYVQLFNHVPTMAAWSVVPTAWAGPDPVATVAADLRRRGLERRRLALVGPWSHRTWQALAAALPDARLVDATTAFRRGRLLKGEEEVTWLRYGAALCDAAVETFVAEAAPGMREDQLAALLDRAHAERGGQTGICFLATASMRDGGAVVPAQVPSRRRVQAGDLAIFELSTGIGGYTSQILRTVAIGGEPSPVVRDLHAVAEAAFEAIAAIVRPGLEAGELERAGALIDRAGLTIVDDLVHGYGGGYLPPVVRTPATRHRPPPELALAAGMCLVIQPNVVSADGRHGVQTGELVLVTEHGAESLHGAPRGLLRSAHG